MTPPSAPGALVLMGVSGCGKTTLGRHLARRLAWEFFDGDDFHPASNVAKMSAGQPLDDDDRAPWLAALRRLLDQRLEARRPAILACSALKKAYRDVLGIERPEVALLHLTAPPQVLAERLRRRSGHFMPPDLLDSQFETLEEPGAEALRLDVRKAPEELCQEVVDGLSLPCPSPDRATGSRTLSG